MSKQSKDKLERKILSANDKYESARHLSAGLLGWQDWYSKEKSSNNPKQKQNEITARLILMTICIAVIAIVIVLVL